MRWTKGVRGHRPRENLPSLAPCDTDKGCGGTAPERTYSPSRATDGQRGCGGAAPERTYTLSRSRRTKGVRGRSPREKIFPLRGQGGEYYRLGGMAVDFDLSDEQRRIQALARRFAREEVAPQAREADERGAFAPLLV